MRKDWQLSAYLVCYQMSRQKELIAIWEEFEAGETAEAKFPERWTD